MGVAGTSAACPVFAGVVAKLNEIRLGGKGNGKPLGFLNPWLYEIAKTHPTAFNDVTSGVNDMGTGKGFAAGQGWDPATGLGTPNFAEMKEAL